MLNLIPITAQENLPIKVEKIEFSNPFSVENESGQKVIRYLDRMKKRYEESDVEWLYPCMPTIEAFETEKRLCKAITRHNEGVITDEALKIFVEDYIKTHTSEKDFTKEWTNNSVPLFHISLYLNGERIPHENLVCNQIAAWIIEGLWLKQHAEAEIKLVKL